MTFFTGHLPDIRDVDAPPGSLNAELLALPQQRTHVHDFIGHVLHLPRTGHVVVPFKRQPGGYDAVVIDGDESYPRGGHHLFVFDLELQTAIEVAPARKYAVEVTTSSVTAELPAASEHEAHELAKLNRAAGHTVAVIERVDFEADDVRTLTEQKDPA